MKGQDWTKEELEKLQEHYGKMPNKELQRKYLPNRTPQSIRRKASELGIALAKRPEWNKEELEKLQENYSKISIEELQKTCLPDRTVDAILGKASDLGLTLVKSPDWTEEEIEKLQEYYGKMPNKELQKTYLPDRTIKAIIGRAVLLGIGSPRSPDWTKEDDEILQEYYGKISNEELREKYLPNRTSQAILGRASILGITQTRNLNWTEEELEKLRKYYNKMPNEELREKYLPNRTIKAIIGKAGSLGIGLPKSPDWTKEDDEILNKCYGKMSSKELQEKYLPNRTLPAIWIRARNLGIASKRGSTGVNEEKKANPDSANRSSALLSTTHSSNPFSDWLAQNIGFSESSIGTYSDAVGAISKEMHQKGTIQKPLETMSPFELDLAIFLIINDRDFATENTRRKLLYRNALKQYRYFLNTISEDSGDRIYMETIENDRQIPETEKTAIIQSRVGQGAFRKSIIDKYNGRCIITGIDHPDLLVASHIKPWAASSNKERLSVDNGLLLSATYDRLFDRGLITFDRYGKIILSSQIGAENIKRLGLSQGVKFNLQINKSMNEHLSYHRDMLFVE